MPYCAETDLASYLLAQYIAAAENKTPGVVAEHITRVSGQIDAYIGERYELPLPSTPPILNWAAAVMVSYRVIGSITSLVNTEGETNNDFVYLQGEYKRAMKTLEDIRDGKIDLFPNSDDEELVDDKTFSVSTPPRRFDDDFLGRY